jgi:VanZ family protein
VVSFLVRGFLKDWLPLVAWMIFIFIGSTDLLSAEHTSRFIGPFLHWFAPNFSDATIGTVQLVVRKCGHLTEYAVLAVLLYRALRRFAPALIVAAIYAAFDEFHQSFVASRTASAWDVAIDCFGAFLGLCLWRLFRNRRQPARTVDG